MTYPKNLRTWRMLQDMVGPIDPMTAMGEWAVQVHNETGDLLARLQMYAKNPTPAEWVNVDELATSLSDMLAGTLK